MRGDCVDSSHTPMCSGGELEVEVVNKVVVTLVLECEWFHVDGDYGPDQLKLVADGFDVDRDGLFPIVEEVLNDWELEIWTSIWLICHFITQIWTLF